MQQLLPIPEHLRHPKRKSVCINSDFPFLLYPLATTNLSISGFAYSGHFMYGLCAWLLSPSTVLSWAIYVVARITSVLHLVLWLSDIPLNGCTAFCLSIHQLMDIFIISSFWLLEIYYNEHLCTSFCVNMFSFLLGIHLAVELLGYVITL